MILKHFLLNQPRGSFTSYRFNGAVVELVEHETLDLVIPGSNPARRGYLCSSRVKQWTPGQTYTEYSFLGVNLSFTEVTPGDKALVYQDR